MTQYEYKCVPCPIVISIKNQAGVNHAMEQFASVLNAGGQKGWEFHSIETITIETAQGCFRKPTSTIYRMLIFKRPLINQGS